MGFAYRHLLRPLLFGLDPERAHEWTARAARAAAATGPGRVALGALCGRIPAGLETTVAGIRFPGPVGLAAGFDKDGKLYPALSRVGFGFVECGTFTALEQPGNPKPRVFRFSQYSALVNRMGFNNPGAERAAEVFADQEAGGRPVPRGINIGKSRAAELAQAGADYRKSLDQLARWADYIAVNVSSPNTPGLRALQSAAALTDLARPLLDRLSGACPLFVKLSPDMEPDEFDDAVSTLAAIGVAGLILTNTTLSREGVPEAAVVEGGLSGRPLRDRSTAWIRRAYALTRGRLPIIGVGGIFSAEDALEKIRAGASLVQVYTGLIYEGPGLPARIHADLARVLRREGSTLESLVGSAASSTPS